MPNTFKNLNETVNDFEFFIKNLSDYLPYIALHRFGSFLGDPDNYSNIAIIGALKVTKELHNATNIIIANIALADFIFNFIFIKT